MYRERWAGYTLCFHSFLSVSAPLLPCEFKRGQGASSGQHILTVSSRSLLFLQQVISGVHLGFLDLCDSTWRAASASVAPSLLWLVCPAGPVVVLVSCVQMLSLRGCLKTGVSSPLKVLQPQGCRETQTCELTSDGILRAADYGQGQQ